MWGKDDHGEPRNPHRGGPWAAGKNGAMRILTTLSPNPSLTC